MSLYVDKTSPPKIINNSLSFILDFFRILAALTVVFFHAFEQWHPQSVSAESNFSKAAHSAVIVFFIISGYVIAFTTSTNNRGGLQYAQARLSRLCSVVLPAILLTAICQIIVSSLDPILGAQYSRSPSYVHYLISILFSNEIWFFSSAPPVNGPLWSLSYEFWFYTIFGLWLYSRNDWKSFVIVLSGCLIAGPKILLLMPVWLYGCLAYLIPQKSRNKIGLILLSTTLFIIFVIVTFRIPLYPYVMGRKPFYYANQFLSDWVIGLLLATALWLISNIEFLNITKMFAKKVRVIADLTFPIYVMHYPLLVLWRAIFITQYNDMFQMWEAVISVLIICSLLGYLLDKQRPLWIAFFKYLLGKLNKVINRNSKVANS